MGMPQRSQTIAQTISYSPQTDCKALKTQVIEHVEVELLPIQSPHPTLLVFLVLEVTLHALNSER